MEALPTGEGRRRAGAREPRRRRAGVDGPRGRPAPWSTTLQPRRLPPRARGADEDAAHERCFEAPASGTRRCGGLPGGGRYRVRMEPGVTPPQILPVSLDRRLYQAIHGLPHTPQSDRYIALLSDAGEGAGWVAAGVGMAWLGGQRGRRAR